MKYLTMRKKVTPQKDIDHQRIALITTRASVNPLFSVLRQLLVLRNSTEVKASTTNNFQPFSVHETRS